MKVLVTGACGFIGNYVVMELHKQGYQVIATSRDAQKAKPLQCFSNVQYIQCDLNESKKNFYQYFNEPELLIHLAWEGLPNYSELFHFEKNLYSNYFFLKSMVENGLKNLVVAGTCFEYGLQNGPLHEKLETKPVNSYAMAKDFLRKFLEQLQNKISFDLKWLRLFYTYGKGQSSDSILSQLDKALDNGEKAFNMSGGEQLRDYLPVEKFAEYIVQVAFQDKVKGIINCCSGVPISIRKIVEAHLAERHKKIHLNFGYYPYSELEPMAFWGDTRKLQKALEG